MSRPNVSPFHREMLELFKRQITQGYELTAAYRYQLADGSEFMRRVRLTHADCPKYVRPIHKVKQKYVIGEPPAPPHGKPLYRLPQLLERKGDVWFVEGEPCAKALIQTGLIATTSGGAGSANAVDLTPLQGRKVILWPDNDAPGRAFMEEVAAKLRLFGCNVETIDVGKLGLSKKGDCVDWLAQHAGATARDVRRLPRIPVGGSPVPALEQRQPTSGGFSFPDDEPWPRPVDGRLLLNDICRTICRFVVADRKTIRAAALWIVHTWLMDRLTVSPIAHITAADKQCGKTVLLEVMSRLVYRPLSVSNITIAVVFRCIEACSPTLLIDEFDSFGTSSDELRGILNSGHTRNGAFVLRCDGDDHIPRQFSTWSAKVLSGIGKLPPTLADRSIRLQLRRKLPTECVEKIRRESGPEWGELRSRIRRWIDDHGDSIARARPSPITGLQDRANDSWEPLLAIATEASDKWMRRARLAAIGINPPGDDAPSLGSELLADIQRAFLRRKATKMHTRDLLEELTKEGDTRWATSSRGQAMSAFELADRLSVFGIGPKQMRIGQENLKGYHVDWFADAFRRYLRSTSV